MKNLIQIDFFEVQLLIEACRNPGTILRSSVLIKAIDVWYNSFTENEREKIYTYYLRIVNTNMLTVEDNIFLARYNPDNQYVITASNGTLHETVTAFLYEGKCHTSYSQFIPDEYIVSKEKLPYFNDGW